jgi:hypothetical protein
MDKPAWFVRERLLAGTGRELPLDGAVCGDGAGDRGDRLERIGVTCNPRFPVTQGSTGWLVPAGVPSWSMAPPPMPTAGRVRAAITGLLATARRVGELGR